ncbi:hypothetical protein PV392_30515 [Streptomyces sp. ME03-5709C]|nr:hypothetical protein [Streptomyces sp. ME03-5709C]
MSETTPEAGAVEEPEVTSSEEETHEEATAKSDGTVVKPDNWHQT